MVEPSAQRKRQLPFKPPSRASSNAGPSTAAAPKSKSKSKQTTMKASTTKATSSAAASKSTNRGSSTSAKRQLVDSPPASESLDGGSDAGSDASVHSRERSLSQEPDYILAEIITHHESKDISLSEPKIPAKLLTRLLHHHFQSEKTKIAKDANTVVAKYADVFVREAIARAAYERAEANSAGGQRRAGDGFLEVEDLEKMAPQLTMDF